MICGQILYFNVAKSLWIVKEFCWQSKNEKSSSMRHGGGAVEIVFDLFLATIHVPLHHLKQKGLIGHWNLFIFMIFAVGD